MAVSRRVRRPLAPADSCRLSTADLETLSGVLSGVLTASRNVVYIHFLEAKFSPCWGRGFLVGLVASTPPLPQPSPVPPQPSPVPPQPSPFPCSCGRVSVGFMAGPVCNIPFEILQQDTVFFKLGSITQCFMCL